MDLLSLPQELFASVLKYVPAENLPSVRKVSSFIDSIVKKYHLDHKRFDQLTIAVGATSTKVILEYDNNLKFYRDHGNEPLLQILKFYFRKMRSLSKIWILGHPEPNHFLITKDFYDLFMKYKRFKLSMLYFHQCELQFSLRLLKKLLKTLAVKELDLKLYVNEERYFPFTDELIDGLQSPSISLFPLSSTTFPTRISLKSVKELCEDNFPKTLTLYRLEVSVMELGKFLEKNLDRWAEMIENWRFGVKPKHLEKKDVDNYIYNLKCLQKYKIEMLAPFLFCIKRLNSKNVFLSILVNY